MKFSELWIRIHGPDTDPDLILIQDFDDQKLKKKIAIYFFLCVWIIMPSWIRIQIVNPDPDLPLQYVQYNFSFFLPRIPNVSGFRPKP
jgi:hypothetical protein